MHCKISLLSQFHRRVHLTANDSEVTVSEILGSVELPLHYSQLTQNGSTC